MASCARDLRNVAETLYRGGHDSVSQLIAGSLVLLPCLSLEWSRPGDTPVLSALVDSHMARLVRPSAAGGVIQVRTLAQVVITSPGIMWHTL